MNDVLVVILCILDDQVDACVKHFACHYFMSLFLFYFILMCFVSMVAEW